MSRPAHRAILGATIVVSGFAPNLAESAPAGHIAPRVRINGKAGQCPFRVHGLKTGRQAPFLGASEDGAPLEVPAGRYRLRVECVVGADTLIPPSAVVVVGAKRTVRPRIDVKRARLRVMATRTDERIRAEVRLYPRNALADEAPLAKGDANLKFPVAAGEYDLLIVQTGGPDKYPPSGWLRRVKVRGSGVVQKKIDLSDGRLSVGVKHNGRRANTSIRVFRPDGQTEAARPDPGRPTQLSPGRYVVEATLVDAADFGAQRKDVWIAPDKSSRTSFSFTTGTLSVEVVRDGKPMDATVHLALPGAGDNFNFFAAPGSVELSPGRYDVTIEPSKAGPIKKERRTGVAVLAGRRSKLRLDLSPAVLQVVVKKAGRRVQAVDVRVLTAGGGDEAAEADASGRFRLWPGRYEILAELDDGAEARDGPFAIKLGEKLTRTIDIARGALVVEAKRGEAVADEAVINIFRPGAKKPVAQTRSGVRIELAPGIYDIKVVAGHEWRWKEGVRIRNGKTARVKVRFKPQKQDPLPEGDDLPEGD